MIRPRHLVSPAIHSALVAALVLSEVGPAEAQAPQPKVALATAPSSSELASIASGLGQSDAGARARALQQLSTLGEDALPAIQQRLESIAARGFDPTLTLAAMSELRRVQGVTAVDEEVNLASGILPLLAKQHDRHALLAAELVALLRALEAQKSPEAAELIVGKLFALDSKLFRYEAPRTRSRLGVLLIPALIRYQGHPRSWIRTFCQESLIALRVDKPGRAVQQDDVGLLASILTAYGATLNFEAMPIVVSYVTDERSEVREASRTAVARYGKNAIWQLRERYLNATGKEADANWGHQRLLVELAKLFEAPTRATFEAALKQATQQLDQGAVASAHASLDHALLVTPTGELTAKAAPLYERIAAHYEASREDARALALYRRALRIAPGASNADQLRARIAYLEAQQRLSQGQVDLMGLQRAVALDPSLVGAREVLDELTGERARRERARRHTIGFSAAALLALAGLLMLRTRSDRPSPANDPVDPEAPATT